jgi:hypothetical protein
MKVASQQMNKNVGPVAGKSGNSGVNIHIHIQDENDNSPVFVPSKIPLYFVSLKLKGIWHFII